MSDSDDGRTEQAEESAAAADGTFQRLLEKLSTEHGFDFREYKHASLARRIRVRMQQLQVETFERYIEHLEGHPDEHVALFNTILINVTGFFRDPPAWDVLCEEVMPRLVEQASESRSLRFWSVGCSSGEEAYTAAIVLAEQLGDDARHFNVKIYATDVDEEALSAARQGLYRAEDVKDVPTSLLERYFAREGQTYRFRRDLRRWVIFGRHNVVQDPPLSHIDLLMCRNVLIYFTSDLQEKILARFHYAVREGGHLFLGRSESLLARSRWFAPQNLKWRIFQRTTAAAPTVAVAMLRAGQETVPAAGSRSLELPESVIRLQQVVEALPTAIMVVDACDTIIIWNAAAEVMYDLPGEAALSRKFRDLDISYRVEGLRSRIEDVRSRHIPARLEDVSFSRRSGEVVHVEISILPLLEGNRVMAVVVAASEAEQIRLKEQMTRVAEQHATGIEELQSTNEELETTIEELQSTNEELETANEELQSTNQELETTVAELQSTNQELETTVAELQAANTELASLNSELERRGADLKQLDDYQRTVLASLGQAVIVLDRNGLVITWNPTAERMWGVHSDDVVGRLFWGLPIGDMPRLAGEPVSQVLAGEGDREVPAVPFMIPTGETRQAVLRLSPLRDSGGVIIGVVGVASPDHNPHAT
jgi:two-component system CheB/CheR fusion protein